jgi:putative Ca2+/H+ antiporter (TMEM165/GDT1 family)
MQTFLISTATVALAEIGDKTQLLSLILAAKYRKPWPICLGILAATLANHAIAGEVGALVASYLTPEVVKWVTAISFLSVALWTLKPDEAADADAARGARYGVFMATVIAFFVAEIGDKTQIATIALAAGFASLPAVILGSTSGMLLANIPAVLLGHAFSRRLPMKAIHYGAAVLFTLLGVYFVARALL